jgi:hypothetical protein
MFKIDLPGEPKLNFSQRFFIVFALMMTFLGFGITGALYGPYFKTLICAIYTLDPLKEFVFEVLQPPLCK